MEHEMKIDLSKLPVNTFIDDNCTGWFYKSSPGIWHEVSAHCVDCEETVYEAEFEGDRVAENPVTQTTAEAYFLDFTVVAVPPGFDLKDAQC